MSLRLETHELTKSFGSFTAVSRVSIAFEPGLIHAVLGENGAGKSTLMKLLFGLHMPSSGEIRLDGRVLRLRNSMDAIENGLGMVQQHFSLVDSLSVIDNIMLGAEVCTRFGRLNRLKAIERLQKLLPTPALALPWYTLVSELTVGEKQRVEILKLLFRDAQILFLDEPTAVLTPLEIDAFFQMLRTLKASGRTVVLITHKINEVMDVCDSYAVLRQGKVVAHGLVRGSSADSIIESMIGRKLPEISMSRSPCHAQTILACQALTVLPGERGGISGVDLELKAGEVVGIAGVEGSGQAKLVDSIMGLCDFTGRIEVLGESVRPDQTSRVRELGVALVPEDRHQQGLWMDESAYNNMIIGLEDRFIEHQVFHRAKLSAETSKWATVFDVRGSSLDIPVSRLSGGNQQKIIFAREISGRKPKLLICHQPTRGVDLGAIDLIHRKILELRNEGLGVLILSSELDELLQLCDRIVVFFEGSVSAQFERKNFDRMKIGAAMTGLQDSGSRASAGDVHGN
jgi:ABC-type uncharacterized transport system ATPase subunit